MGKTTFISYRELRILEFPTLFATANPGLTHLFLLVGIPHHFHSQTWRWGGRLERLHTKSLVEGGAQTE